MYIISYWILYSVNWPLSWIAGTKISWKSWRPGVTKPFRKSPFKYNQPQIIFILKSSHIDQKNSVKIIGLKDSSKNLAELEILTIFWSLNLCLHSLCGAKSAWLPSMWAAKSVLLPSMCGTKSANLLSTWMRAKQTLLRTWKGAMQTLLRTWSGDIVSGTKKLLKLQFLLIKNK